MEPSKANTIDNNVKQTTTKVKPYWHEVDQRYKPIKMSPERLQKAEESDKARKRFRKQSEYNSNKEMIDISEWQRANRGRDMILRNKIVSGQQKMPFYIVWKCDSNPIYNNNRPRGKRLSDDCGKVSFKRATELPEQAHSEGRRALAVCQHCKKKASLISRPYKILETKLDAKQFTENVNRRHTEIDKKYGEWLV